MKFRKILALNLAEADVSLIVLCATGGARSNSVFMSGTADTDHRSRRPSSREIVGYSTSVRLRARTHTVLYDVQEGGCSTSTVFRGVGVAPHRLIYKNKTDIRT